MIVRFLQLGVVLLAGVLTASIGGRPYATAAPGTTTVIGATTVLPSIPKQLDAAEWAIRAIVPSIERYRAAHSGYTGMTVARLRAAYGGTIPTVGVWVSPRDPHLPAGVTDFEPTQTEYCVIARVGAWYAWKHGAAAVIQSSKRSALVCRW